MPAQMLTEFFEHGTALLEAFGVEGMGKLFNGIRRHGTGEHLAQGHGINPVILDGRDGGQCWILLQLSDLLIQSGGAVIIDDNHVGVRIQHGLPGHNSPGLFHIFKHVDAARMADQLGSEIIAAGVCPVVTNRVKHKNLHRIGSLNGSFHVGNLFLHSIHNFSRFVLKVKNLAQIFKIRVNIFYIRAQLVAFDGGQGGNAVAGENIVGGAVLFAECRAAAIDKIRFCSSVAAFSAMTGAASYIS